MHNSSAPLHSQVLLPPQAHSTAPYLHKWWCGRHQKEIKWSLGQSKILCCVITLYLSTFFVADRVTVWKWEWRRLKGQTQFCCSWWSCSPNRLRYNVLIFMSWFLTSLWRTEERQKLWHLVKLNVLVTEFTRPRLGCRVLVRRNFSKVLPAILKDMTDWTLESRIKVTNIYLNMVIHNQL